MNEVFSIYDTTPEPPESRQWTAILRWCVAVMDDNDPSLEFASGCLHYTIKNDGLRPKQAEACNAIFERLCYSYDRGKLDCQFDPNKEPPKDNIVPLEVVKNEEREQ